MAVDAFWDTSALVPLCTIQGATPRAVAHHANYDIVVWWATPVEIAAALARLVRTKHITPSGLAKAQNAASKLAAQCTVVLPTDDIKIRAFDVIARHDLRAADSLQLAAALKWCNDQPDGHVFLSADHRLRHAALAAGFDAKTV